MFNFLNIGVDFAGPLYIKVKTTEEDRKAYMASFVCCTTRACHLEFVPELSADTFCCVFADLWREEEYGTLLTRITRKHLKPLIVVFRSLRTVLSYRQF